MRSPDVRSAARAAAAPPPRRTTKRAAPEVDSARHPDGAGPAPEYVVVTGSFDSVDSSTDRNLAFYDVEADAWAQPVPALPGAFGVALAAGEQGQLAAAIFPEDPQAGITDIFEWDGVAWQKLPPVAPTAVGRPSSPEYDSLGVLYSLGYPDLGFLNLRAAAWDGVAWQTLTGLSTITALDLAIGPDDSVYVSATENLASSFGPINAVSRWNGTFWEPAFTGTQVTASRVEGFAFLSDGRVAASGAFDDGVSPDPSKWGVWDGTDWSIPAGSPIDQGGLFLGQAIELPTGEVLFAATMPSDSGEGAQLMGKWDGAQLVEFASVQQGEAGGLTAVVADGRGAVWAAGKWDVDPQQSLFSGLSRTALPCAAQVAAVGNPGQGSAGAIELGAENAPWLGGTFRAEVSGMDVQAVPFTLIGSQLVSQPLSSLTPIADASSFLYLQPNLALTEVLGNQQGSATYAVGLPADGALAGLLIGLQVAAIELDALGQPNSAATSNALVLTLGSY